MRLRWKVFIFWNVGWWMFLYLPSLKTPSANGIWTDITGEYSLSLADVQGEVIKGYPFLDMDMERTGGTVAITQGSDNSITFLNQMKSGRHARKSFFISGKSNLYWNDGCLIYHERKMMVGGGIFPGWGIQCRKSLLEKDTEGNLQIKYEQNEKCMALFLMPYFEKHQSYTLLRLYRSADAGR